MSDPFKIVIAGGGTAGWMTAAALARFSPKGATLTLIESESIGTVGVGEATIPPLADFNHMLGIDEHTFLAETGGTYKLGIDFQNWGERGERYFHPFSQFGFDLDGIAFHQVLRWTEHPASLDTFCIGAQAAARGRFMPPRHDDAQSPLAQMRHAYHIDAGRYAAFLRRYAEQRGVDRVEGIIQQVSQCGQSGEITQLTLNDDRTIEGDFFVDCTGFRARLLDDTLGVDWQDWSHWLPCDRALAVPSARAEPLESCTRAIAHESGWQWRIPLQHRTGNGHVYCSSFCSDDKAHDVLMAHLDTAAEAEPKPLKFKTGRRTALWSKNCVAIGLSGGFLEPLESTSIHLIQEGISKLLALFPSRDDASLLRDEYNELMLALYDDVRDFIILHYNTTRRDDSEFWRMLRTMSVPETLTERTERFAQRGQWFSHRADLFAQTSWVAVMLGQGLQPHSHHPLLGALDRAAAKTQIDEMAQVYTRAAELMPPHAAYIDRFCRIQDATARTTTA